MDLSKGNDFRYIDFYNSFQSRSTFTDLKWKKTAILELGLCLAIGLSMKALICVIIIASKVAM